MLTAVFMEPDGHAPVQHTHRQGHQLHATKRFINTNASRFLMTKFDVKIDDSNYKGDYFTYSSCGYRGFLYINKYGSNYDKMGQKNSSCILNSAQI
jgi:hypothetical protein